MIMESHRGAVRHLKMLMIRLRIAQLSATTERERLRRLDTFEIISDIYIEFDRMTCACEDAAKMVREGL